VAKSKKDYKKKLAKFLNIEPQHLEPPANKEVWSSRCQDRKKRDKPKVYAAYY
jgi:hypothetical protein